eukprot:scaffold284423_cov19-Tisochrysis_lutea.AAC.1
MLATPTGECSAEWSVNNTPDPNHRLQMQTGFQSRRLIVSLLKQASCRVLWGCTHALLCKVVLLGEQPHRAKYEMLSKEADKELT